MPVVTLSPTSFKAHSSDQGFKSSCVECSASRSFSQYIASIFGAISKTFSSLFSSFADKVGFKSKKVEAIQVRSDTDVRIGRSQRNAFLREERQKELDELDRLALEDFEKNHQPVVVGVKESASNLPISTNRQTKQKIEPRRETSSTSRSWNPFLRYPKVSAIALGLLTVYGSHLAFNALHSFGEEIGGTAVEFLKQNEYTSEAVRSLKDGLGGIVSSAWKNSIGEYVPEVVTETASSAASGLLGYAGLAYEKGKELASNVCDNIPEAISSKLPENAKAILSSAHAAKIPLVGAVAAATIRSVRNNVSASGKVVDFTNKHLKTDFSNGEKRVLQGTAAALSAVGAYTNPVRKAVFETGCYIRGKGMELFHNGVVGPTSRAFGSRGFSTSEEDKKAQGEFYKYYNTTTAVGSLAIPMFAVSSILYTNPGVLAVGAGAVGIYAAGRRLIRSLT